MDGYVEAGIQQERKKMTFSGLVQKHTVKFQPKLG